MAPSPSSPSAGLHPSWPAAFAVALAAFVAHFYYLRTFGFYEDDYWATVPFLGEKLSAIPSILAEAFQRWPQGRPLNHSLPKVQAILGMHLAGPEGIYAIACAAFVLNSLLVFSILRRAFGERPALVGALLYVLFPADVTRPFLVHAAHVQGGMTFFLLGTWLWFRGGRWRPAGYVVAALSLTAYETAFLPFLTIPLLAGDNLRATWKGLLRHLLICAGIIVAYGVFRLTRGESRAVDALGDPWTSVGHILNSLYLGPWTSGTRVLWAPFEKLGRIDSTSVICALFVAGAAWLALRPAAIDRVDAPAATSPRSQLYFIACAILTWVGSYALTLTNYPPTQTLGRLTSTHTAAAWSVAWLACAIAAWLGTAARPKFVRPLVCALGLAYLVAAVGFCQWVQREYVRSWQLQRDFWRQVVTLSPEARDGWAIIVVGSPAPASPVIATNSWADTLLCRTLFNTKVDFAHLGYLGSAMQFAHEHGTVQWTPEYWTKEFKELDEHKLILLQSEGGRLRRVNEVTVDAGFVLHGQPATSPFVESSSSSVLATAIFGRKH